MERMSQYRLNGALHVKRYLLYHMCMYGGNNQHEKIKMLGIYSSEWEASKQ
ncbi:MAG: hypothetical protein K2N34_09340 [Lachnospiraceae bacterium]|nr:hypothetical protein [Lachnospiraceae bacterium]